MEEVTTSAIICLNGIKDLDVSSCVLSVNDGGTLTMDDCRDSHAPAAGSK